MNKVKIDLKVKNIDFDFKINEKEKLHVEVIPYISMENEVILMQSYIQSYFNKDNFDFVLNYISAENGNILGVLDLCTNIDIKNINVDDVVGSGLWTWVKNRIKNYDKFENDLQKIVIQINKNNEIEKSMGNSFDKVSNAVVQFFGKVSELDFSAEGISKLVNELKNVSGEYESKFMNKQIDSKEKLEEIPKE
jgi:hypothetical protein